MKHRFSLAKRIMKQRFEASTLAPYIKRTRGAVGMAMLVSRNTCQAKGNRPKPMCPFLKRNTPDFSVKMNNTKSQGKGGRGLGRMLKEQKARMYIIRRCVAMLLCHHD